MRLFFLFFFISSLYGDATNYLSFHAFNPAREFPAIEEMCVGYVQNDFCEETYYDLLISNEPVVDANKIERLVQWCPNGYLKCKKEAIFPLLKILMKYGKEGKIVDEDPMGENASHVVVWKNFTTTAMQEHTIETTSAIGYAFSQGRLGDNIVAYLHAKWLSLKTGIPLVYTPFNDAEHFCFHQEACYPFYENQFEIVEESDIDLNAHETLFVVPYFPESILDYQTVNAWHLPYFKVDFDDPLFKESYRKDLQPTHAITSLELPHDKIKVALHIRRGGVVDHPRFHAKIFPLKFPPDTYYIEQLKSVYALFDQKPLYVHIFTDATNQRGIIKKYKKILRNLDIEFGYSKTPDLIDDFYQMGNFDVLIRSTSNYSFIASLLQDSILTIAPLHAKVENDVITIDRFDISFKGSERFKKGYHHENNVVSISDAE